MKTVGIIVAADKYGGGVYQYTQSLVAALKNDTSRKYILFCHDNDNRFDNYGLEIRRYKKQQSNVFTKVIRLFQLLFLIQRPILFSKQEKKIFSDVDIWVSPTIELYPHFYLSKPYIFTLHDMQERYYPEYFSKKELFLRWLINRALVHCATKIMCESEYVKKDIVNFTKTQPIKIIIIKSPPPLELLNIALFPSDHKRVKKKYNLPEKFIYYPAQYWPHKNHIRLIEAFKIIRERYNDIYLVLSGSQQNNYSSVLRRIKTLGLDLEVKHLGYIDYEDIPSLYKLSIMLVMPTLFESVSIPIYEAFALNIPVCCSNVVGLPDQVGEAALLFDPFNVDDIADKISLYLDNEEMRFEKAKLGYSRMKDFNHKMYSKKLLDVLAAI
jgi:glycosyltransferase involved in cell wall biosynthesis